MKSEPARETSKSGRMPAIKTEAQPKKKIIRAADLPKILARQRREREQAAKAAAAARTQAASTGGGGAGGVAPKLRRALPNTDERAIAQRKPTKRAKKKAQKEIVRQNLLNTDTAALLPTTRTMSNREVAQAVQMLYRQGVTTGVLTLDEINEALPGDVISPNHLDRVLIRFDALGIEVMEDEMQHSSQGHAPEVRFEDDQGRRAIRRLKPGEERIDDPVRTYLQQMGEIPLLTRDEEIALAKKIRDHPQALPQARARVAGRAG